MKDNATSRSSSTEEKLDIVIAPPYNNKLAEIETRNRHFKLYRAALKGDWKTAERIYEEDKIDITARISREGDTTLHIAAATGRTDFVKKLLEKMKKEDLSIKNNAGCTAFFLAAASGRVEIIKAMMEKNEDLVQNRGDNDMLPLHKAALTGNKEMVEYLYEVTRDELLDDANRFELLVSLINNGLYDVALDLADRHQELAIARDKNKETALHHLARMLIPKRTFDLSLVRRSKRLLIYVYKEVKREVIKACHSVLGRRNELALRDRIYEREQRRRNSLGWSGRNNETVSRMRFSGKETPRSAFELISCLWKQVMLLDDSQILEILRKPWPLIFEAAKRGNLEFLNIILGSYPDLMFEVDENRYTIFHFAVMYRHLNIFRIMYSIGQFKDLVVRNTDEEGNNILHLAAKMPPPDRHNVESAGAAYQLRRELWWFKRVKKILQPLDAEATNKKGKTARAVFTEQHEELKDKAEKWTKDIANACIVAATLIATVVFAAVLTVPGGTKEETGTPHFVQRASFIIFAVSDTIVLLLSLLSILRFISVISSRYEEEDFMSQLICDLGCGLNLLLYAVELMMIVFCATMFIIFKDGMLWTPILITAMTAFTSFLFLEKFGTVQRDVLHFTLKSGENPFEEEK